MSKKTQALERLEEHRLLVAERLGDVRRSLEREIGWAPKARIWALPLVAFACGIALAAFKGRRQD